MTSYHGYTPSYDYTHMYNMSDYKTPDTTVFTKKGSVMDYIQHAPQLRAYAYMIKLGQFQGILNDEQFGGTVFVARDTCLDPKIIRNMTIMTARNMMQYSILRRPISADLLRSDKMMLLYARSGMSILVKNDGDKTYINNTYLVDSVHCKNGIVHILSDALVPI